MGGPLDFPLDLRPLTVVLWSRKDGWSAMHRARTWAWGFLSIAALGLVSCYPGTIESTEELGTVTTLFDPNEDFTQNHTYALADTIMHICDIVDGETDCIPISRAFDSEILDRIESEMNALGYTKVDLDPDNPPDLLVETSAVARKGYAIIGSYCDWWYWYYPYYCYYPPYWSTVEYETGSIFITMLDPSRPNTEDRIPIVWTGVVNGVLSNATTNVERALEGIGQAFAQSSYLDVSGGAQ
jgi:hypothetical protein